MKTAHKGASALAMRPARSRREVCTRLAARRCAALAGEAGFNPYDQPEYLDPPLTEAGRKQAPALEQQHACALWPRAACARGRDRRSEAAEI